MDGFKDNDNGKRSGTRKRNATLTLATWNVRTMLKAGKMAEIAEEVLKYGMDVVALQEIRWNGNGRVDKKDYSMFYSGPKMRTGQCGTGFILNNKMKQSCLGFEPLGDRMCKIRLKGRFRNLSIISAYAPTEDANDDEKNAFYDQLDRECSKIPKYDVLILLGDFNAKIGREDFLQHVAGKHSLHTETNENGMMLSQLAEAKGLIIKSTCFANKDIHKGTWKMAGTGVVNQIDHVLVSRRHASSVVDIRSARGPNCDSDHYLVKAKLRERIANVGRIKGPKRIQWSVEKFRQPAAVAQYQETLGKKLEEGAENLSVTDSVERKWLNIKKAMEEAAKETIGERKRTRNEEWFDNECRKAIERKNIDRRNTIQKETRQNVERYKESRRQANKILRKKKKQFLKGYMEKIEELNTQNESRKLYQAIKRMTNKFQPRTNECKDKNGRLVGTEEEVLGRWAEYFKELLNVNEIDEEDGEMLDVRVDTKISGPSIEEVEESLKRQRNGRAPGEDQIVPELIKYGGKNLTKNLHRLICEIWEKEEMPEEWKIGFICPIFKKGDKLQCSNYRGITLLNVTYKILSCILQRRLNTYAEVILGEYQCGFRPGRGTTDQIFAMRQCMEKCYEYNIDLHMLFIDFQQAFDSINRRKMLKALEGFGIPKKLIKLVNMTMEGSQAKAYIGGKTSEAFKITTGVRQGDSLSAVLFNLCLHEAMKELRLEGTIVHKSTQTYAYADDIVLMARNMDSLKEIFKILEQKSKNIGLRINERKTKYMKMSATEDRRWTQNVAFGQYNFENVKYFSYLGTNLNCKNSMTEEINKRIMAGNRAYFANIKLLKSTLLSKEMKFKIYKTLIRPVVTYGAETWTISAGNEQALRIFERKVLRRIYGPVTDGVTWRIRTNKEIENIIRGEDIVRFVKTQRLAWLGHVERMSEERVPKKLLHGNMDGKRKRGRPRKRWMQDVEEDIKTMRIVRWWEKVQNRREWTGVLREAKAHTGL